MVDRTLILRKFTDFDEYQKQLGEFSNITVNDYSKDWKTQRIVERTLQMLIEVGIDIANNIISDQGMRVPLSYSDTFKVLHENKIIDDGLYQSMEKMAKFINLIVHNYDKIDPAIVVQILQKFLDDFTSYKVAILEWINKKG